MSEEQVNPLDPAVIAFLYGTDGKASMLESAIREAIAAEREACANLVFNSDWAATPEAVANAIRERK